MTRYTLFSIITFCFGVLITHDVYGMHDQADTKVQTGCVVAGVLEATGTTDEKAEKQDPAKKKRKRNWVVNSYKSKKRRKLVPTRGMQYQDESEDYEGDEGDGAEETETEEVRGGDAAPVTALELMLKQRASQDKLLGSEKDSDKAAALLLQDAVLKKPSILAKLKKVIRDPLCRGLRHVGEVAGVYQLSNTIWLCKDMALCLGNSAVDIAMCTATGGFVVIALADLGLTVYDLLCYARTPKEKDVDFAQVWTAS